MRSLLAAVLVCVLSALIWVPAADAVGYVVVGKEECSCNPLVARGIIPDPLNQLQEAFVFPTLVSAVDRLAVDVRELLANVGAQTASVTPSDTPVVEPKEPATKSDDKGVKDKEKDAKDKAAVEKPKKKVAETKKKKKSAKPKRVKLPPQAM
jgi:outer membrane biosynthesis protein TonB